jgi:hypothetical protein
MQYLLPMNFRRTRNSAMSYAMTHLAGVADRIGRSYSPVVEGRSGNSMSILKERCGLRRTRNDHSGKREAPPIIAARSP